MLLVTYGETYTAETGIWIVTGSRADVNGALAAVSFAPVVNDDLSIRDLWMKAHGYV